MLKQPFSYLEEAYRDTSFGKAENDLGYPIDEIWRTAFDRIVNMHNLPRPPWVQIQNWRRATKIAAFGHKGMFWNLFCFLERVFADKHETVTVTVGNSGAGTGDGNDGDIVLTATNGFKFTNRHVGRFIRLTPVGLDEDSDTVTFTPSGGSATEIDHPYLRQEDVLLYSVGGGTEPWKIVTDDVGDGTGGADTLTLAVHGAYGTRFKTNFMVKTPIDETHPEFDASKGFQIQTTNYGGAVFNTAVDKNGLSPNEITPLGVATDKASNYFWLPPGTYNATFLGFSIEEMTGNYIASLKDSNGDEVKSSVKMGDPLTYCLVKIILFTTEDDQLPATYVQGVDGPLAQLAKADDQTLTDGQAAVEETSPPLADPAWLDALPFGGQIQINQFEPGNNEGGGPFPIYLEGTGQGPDFGLFDIVLNALLVAGVVPKFIRKKLLDFEEA